MGLSGSWVVGAYPRSSSEVADVRFERGYVRTRRWALGGVVLLLAALAALGDAATAGAAKRASLASYADGARVARSLTPVARPASSPTVMVTVDGTGLVSFADSEVSCAGRCAVPEVGGRMVVLTAVPGTGSVFSGWTGTCVGAAPVCAVTATATTAVTATFTSPNKLLSATVSGPGVISSNPPNAVSCGTPAVGPPLDGCAANSIAPNQQVVLTATPDPGAVFAGWGGVCAQYTTTSCELQGRPFTGVTASFEYAVTAPGHSTLAIAPHGLVPLASAPAGVLASCPSTQGSACNAPVALGETVILVAGGPFEISQTLASLPDLHWSGDCVGVWPVCSLIVDALTLPVQLFSSSPEFLLTGTGLSLTVSRGGVIALNGGGTCSLSHSSGCRPTIPLGQPAVTLVARASHGYRFAGWQSGSEGCYRMPRTCTIPPAAGETEIAAFRRR